MAFNPNDLNPKVKQWRAAVLDSFDPVTGYYYHTDKKAYDGFIDMLAWVGLMACGCKYIGDDELLCRCVQCVNTTLRVGKDARTFAPHQVTDSWLMSKAIPSMWYKAKPQSFAGPAAWYKMRKLGLPVIVPTNDSFTLESVEAEAKSIARWAMPFGYAAKLFPSLRQHINSMWLALMVLGKKSPSSMEWTKYDNPFYKAIDGESYTDLNAMPYSLPNWSNSEKVACKELQPTLLADSSDWIWRRDPYNQLKRSEESTVLYNYTPLALLTAAYYQLRVQGVNG